MKYYDFELKVLSLSRAPTSHLNLIRTRLDLGKHKTHDEWTSIKVLGWLIHRSRATEAFFWSLRVAFLTFQVRLGRLDFFGLGKYMASWVVQKQLKISHIHKSSASRFAIVISWLRHDINQMINLCERERCVRGKKSHPISPKKFARRHQQQHFSSLARALVVARKSSTKINRQWEFSSTKTSRSAEFRTFD